MAQRSINLDIPGTKASAGFYENVVIEESELVKVTLFEDGYVKFYGTDLNTSTQTAKYVRDAELLAQEPKMKVMKGVKCNNTSMVLLLSHVRIPKNPKK